MLHLDGPRLCSFLLAQDIRQDDFRERLLAQATPPGTVSFLMRTLHGVSRPAVSEPELAALTAALGVDRDGLRRAGVAFVGSSGIKAARGALLPESVAS